MNKKSLIITTGAMVTAIFGVMLWLNRQSGNLFQEIFIFLYPIPMVAFSAMYGLKNGIPVCASMSLIAFLFGDFMTIFYALTQAVIGLVFGGCLYHKVDMTKTLLVVMLLSAFVNLLNTVFLGFLFGIDMNQEVLQLQTMMSTMVEKRGTEVPEHVMTINTLKQIFIVSMILSGFIQGFIVYEVSLLLLRRLRFSVQKPKPVLDYMPPKWSGYAAFGAYLLTNRLLMQPLEQEVLQNAGMMIGIFAYMFLICFGCIAIMRLLKARAPRVGKFGIVICLLGVFVFSMAEAMLGFIYIVRQERWE